MAKVTNIAIVPSPGMGHLIPLVEFARRLVVTHPNFRVTLIVPLIGQPTKPVKSMLDSLPITIQHVYLPHPVTFDAPPQPPRVLMSAAMSRSVPRIREVLSSLSEKDSFSAIVFDMFSSEASESVNEGFNIPIYMFFPSNAAMLSFCFYIPKLDRVVSCEYRDMVEPVQIPGCFPVHGRDFPDPVQDRKSKAYESIFSLVERLRSVDGIMVNTFTEMEEGAIKALKQEKGVPPIYPVGPIVNDGSSDRVEESECLQWLDKHPRGSVLFVSFGSGGTLSHSQLNELANGLEKSDQKFLWVVRKPNDTSANAAYHGDHSHEDPLQFLPSGFLERTKGKGLVVPNWAPQSQILGHKSIGGFLTHCGWNSTLESIVNGQPLIVWPLHAEQKTNAVLLSEHLNIGLRPKMNDRGIVTQDEVSKIVKALMEGEEGKVIRKRMKVVQEGAKRALSEEGDSTKTLAELALKWTNYDTTCSNP